MKKVIAIYFSLPGIHDYPFDSLWYLDAYKDIITRVTAEGIRVVIVRADSYRGNGVFREYSEFIDDTLVSSSEEIYVDYIFNRDNKNTIPRIDDCPIINHPDIDDLCVDKYKTAQEFPAISPKTGYTHTFEQVISTITSWQLKDNQLIVLKKNYEHSGKGIHIIPISDVKEGLYDDWSDILVQEFKDSREGIPGIVEGAHDIRIYVVNRKPVVAMVRTPKEGTLLANIAKGGKGFTLDIEDVDDEIFEHIDSIQEVIDKKGPSLYAADFLRADDGKYYLVELNSRAGVPNPAWKQYDMVRDAFVSLLVDAIKE